MFRRGWRDARTAFDKKSYDFGFPGRGGLWDNRSDGRTLPGEAAPMSAPPQLPRQAYIALRDYPGKKAYLDVLKPWALGSGAWLSDLLGPLATYRGWRRERYEFGDLLEQ